VFTANFASNNISGYTINAQTGALTPIAGSPFATGDTPTSVVIDPAGNFVLVTNAGSGTVSAYSISANGGSLSAISGSPFSAGALPSALAFSTAVQVLPP